MNPLTWQNSVRHFVAQDIIKVKIYSVAELNIKIGIEDESKIYDVLYAWTPYIFCVSGGHTDAHAHYFHYNECTIINYC